jgi:hypothetical protein
LDGHPVTIVCDGPYELAQKAMISPAYNAPSARMVSHFEVAALRKPWFVHRSQKAGNPVNSCCKTLLHRQIHAQQVSAIASS